MLGAQSQRNMLDSRFQYSEEEHSHYDQEGYRIFDYFLTEEALEYCRSRIEEIVSELGPGIEPEKIYSAHQLGAKWIWEIGTQPQLLDMIERQIGPNVVLWSSHLLCKPPQTGIPVPWHQDAPYWNVSELSGGVWIPFDDVDHENGAMAILPGWHKKGVLERLVRDANFFDEEIDPNALPPDIDELKVEYNLRAGQMATHDAMIPHNSPPNRSERWRRVLVLRYMSAEGDMGEKEYIDYRNGAPFQREYYLVRGTDVLGRGLPKGPPMDWTDQ